MIPKKIHFCWLSGDNLPYNIIKCMNSWKEIMPDYEIICWDKKKFEVESVQFVNEACLQKKWAFASDYIRLYAIYKEGGIYLDSDVLIKKKFDPLLGYDFFTAVEYHPLIFEQGNSKQYLNEDGTSKYPFTPIEGFGIQAAVLGGIKGHPFLKDCMDYYRHKRFLHDEGIVTEQLIVPNIYSITAEKYGFKYKDNVQLLKGNMLVLPSVFFAGTPLLASKESFAIHYGVGSWRDKRFKNPGNKLINKFKNNNFIRMIFRKPSLIKTSHENLVKYPT